MRTYRRVIFVVKAFIICRSEVGNLLWSSGDEKDAEAKSDAAVSEIYEIFRAVIRDFYSRSATVVKPQ